MKTVAVILWVAAWFCAGLIPASRFAARNGNRAVAGAELAAGLIGAVGFAWAGAAAW